MDLGKKIREARERKLMTQKELAEAIGVTPVIVSVWENGWKRPRFENLKKLIATLGLKKSDLQ